MKNINSNNKSNLIMASPVLRESIIENARKNSKQSLLDKIKYKLTNLFKK